MINGLILRGIECLSRTDMYLGISVVLSVLALVFIFSTSDNEMSIGYFLFINVISLLFSFLWPLTMVVLFVLYISLTLKNIIKINKERIKIKNKLCGITDC